MVAPGSRLHGASDRGSAAAPVSEPTAPVLIAPAKTSPRPSSARRSSRPLPATALIGEDSVLGRRRSEVPIFPPFLPLVGDCYCPRFRNILGVLAVSMSLLEIGGNEVVALICSPHRIGRQTSVVLGRE